LAEKLLVKTHGHCDDINLYFLSSQEKRKKGFLNVGDGCIVWQKFTDVSEVLAASIIRAMS
jgi:hypothetical protein